MARLDSANAAGSRGHHSRWQRPLGRNARSLARDAGTSARHRRRSPDRARRARDSAFASSRCTRSPRRTGTRPSKKRLQATHGAASAYYLVQRSGGARHRNGVRVHALGRLEQLSPHELQRRYPRDLSTRSWRAARATTRCAWSTSPSPTAGGGEITDAVRARRARKSRCRSPRARGDRREGWFAILPLSAPDLPGSGSADPRRRTNGA